ncbi:MAG: hypothetical protein ACR2G5_08805 [Pyrinomonadaceae bacterium]
MSTLLEDARSGLAPFDPFHPDFLDNPYRFYATYREADPVHWGAPPEPMAPGCWYIMRHDDARFVDPRLCGVSACHHHCRPARNAARQP